VRVSTLSRLPLDDAIHALRCPHCRGPLAREENSLRCGEGHAFDIARQGYVTLTATDLKHPGDTAAMIEAREAFQGAGHYEPIAATLAELAAASEASPGAVLELGAGTGYYLGAILEAMPARAGIAIDASTHAARRAAKVPRTASIRCDAWQRLPLGTGTIGIALSVFSPRNAAELSRVLAPGGWLVVVTPALSHLADLADALGLIGIEPAKQERVATELAEHFEPGWSRSLEFEIELTHADALALTSMGPSAYHSTPEELAAKVASLPEPARGTAALELTLHRRP
jgi:23S rRNA (guanine745-N1)-methyltransferase